jgi:peptidoglycan hydrolase-like amidase
LETMFQPQLPTKKEEEKTMKCKICDRKSRDRYCVLHKKAYRNVVQKFEYWKRVANISLKEYLKAVVENAYTGSWAREVAEQLLKNEVG